jgi:hypothetical protein
MPRRPTRTERTVQSVNWSDLNPGAKAVRIGHIGVAAVGLGSLAYVWACALTGRRDRLLAASCIALSAQGIAILIGRGKCPLGPLQQRLGDPTPCFELVLPPRAAKAALPVLVPVALGGVILVALPTAVGRGRFMIDRWPFRRAGSSLSGRHHILTSSSMR